MSDEFEVKFGLDTKSVDSDGDGLNDQHEVDIGTDPLDADSDGDGVSDFHELKLGTDPLDDADTPTDDMLEDLLD